ncbi:hypothetical protein ACHWQZ_G009457 [Mnemiopsis leidyi]
MTEIEKIAGKAPYVFIIRTGADYPQLRSIKKWNDGTMMITVNPGSQETESRLLRIKEQFSINSEGSVRVEFWLSETVGIPKLLKVDLESNKLEIVKEALFVREVTVLYKYQVYRFPLKNYVYPHNPIRGNPTVAKMGCPPHFLVREGIGTLKHHETEEFLIKAREEDLKTLQSMVQWVDPKKVEGTLLYPGHLAIEKYDKLPRFLQFRESRLDTYLSLKFLGVKQAEKNAVKNILQKVVGQYHEERFTSFDHYKLHLIENAKVMNWSKTELHEALSVIEVWEEDEECGRQILLGPHAIKLTKVKTLDGRWRQGLSKLADHHLEGKTPDQALQGGLLYEVTTDTLIGIKHGGRQSLKLTGTKQTWYVTLADCLVYQRSDNKVVPVLIRLENRVDEEPETWWVPPPPGSSKDDPEYLQWLLAKMYFRGSDLNRYSLCAHFCRAHAVGEVFGVAAYRNLPNAHPILRLLQPHIQGIIPVNVHARVIFQAPEDGGFSMFIGVGDQTREVFENYFKEFCYEELLFPRSIEVREVQDVPGYYHRDDMLASWKIIEAYVNEMVDLTYATSEDVLKDEEIQNFAREIAEHGFGRFEKKAGFPRSISNKEKLCEYLTAIVFNFSFYHASVNFQTFKYSFPPNAPTCMLKPPPAQDEVITMDRILDSLPVGELAFLSYNVAYNLAQYSPIERFFLEDPAEDKLGIIGENMAVAPEQEACIRRMVEGMRQLKQKIDDRNSKLKFRYDLLSPSNVPITTQT